ncbi:MAG: bifunctional 4'-phosphopantothenoylcysteine decarboxylase/phosphopantothenoylcysteine synthetase, partial [Chloroflexota bacterium]|nr:bifunctional 4'-phosphopantothenoylcysteine decarboxylase/phosphopantothenoylcysteine synthetase [Chloroflexota bacterium]
CEGAGLLVMAAAVSDYRPEAESSSKLKKTDQDLVLRLVENRDILADVSYPGLVKVGFAAETENLLENARAKLERKALHMVVANDAAPTIGAREAALTLVDVEGRSTELGSLSKGEAARKVIEAASALLPRVKEDG